MVFERKKNKLIFCLRNNNNTVSIVFYSFCLYHPVLHYYFVFFIYFLFYIYLFWETPGCFSVFCIFTIHFFLFFFSFKKAHGFRNLKKYQLFAYIFNYYLIKFYVFSLQHLLLQFYLVFILHLLVFWYFVICLQPFCFIILFFTRKLIN